MGRIFGTLLGTEGRLNMFEKVLAFRNDVVPEQLIVLTSMLRVPSSRKMDDNVHQQKRSPAETSKF